MDCAYCHRSVSGEAYLRGVEVMHKQCRKDADAKASGLPFPCPQCKTQGTVGYIVRHGEWGYSDDVWGKKKCEVCGGEGYTKHEMVRVPVKFEWRQKP